MLASLRLEPIEGLQHLAAVLAIEHPARQSATDVTAWRVLSELCLGDCRQDIDVRRLERPEDAAAIGIWSQGPTIGLRLQSALSLDHGCNTVHEPIWIPLDLR